jgi:hypothetical protein
MIRDYDLITSHFLNRKGDRGNILTVLLGVLIIIALSACGTYNLRGKLDQSINQYNDLLRGHKLDAASVFAIETLSKEFSARAEAAKNMRMVDYRIVAMKYDEKKGEAEVQVEIDYYTFSTFRLKTVVDNQKWAYLEEKGTKQWRLTSLLPEFP